MVVLLDLVSLVVRFLLLLTVVSLGPTGTMALLYYFSSYYTLRGGYSGHGIYCGVFFVRVNYTASGTVWIGGAALSFKLSTHYTLRGGNSGNGAYCGVFSVAARNAFSYSYWSTGAALDYFILCSSWWCF